MRWWPAKSGGAKDGLDVARIFGTRMSRRVDAARGAPHVPIKLPAGNACFGMASIPLRDASMKPIASLTGLRLGHNRLDSLLAQTEGGL
jgi:hypothetical protein